MAEVVVRWLDEHGDVRSGDESALDTTGSAAWRWVDVTHPDDDAIARLAERFSLHPLAVDHLRHAIKRAKLDIFPDGVFIVWLTPAKRSGDGVVQRELDVFLRKDVLVTIHEAADPDVDAIVGDAKRAMSLGADFTLHAVIDRSIDSVLPIVDAIGERMEVIETRMLDNPRQDDLRKLHAVRRQLLVLHRLVSPERDVIRGLVRERDIVGEEAYRYFLDVEDHLSRVQDSIETYQDVGASVMDVYLSAQSNRMNEIMKQLTVVATIFMPLTLISGIYGMNLIRDMWPSPAMSWSFPAVAAFMAALAVAMAWYFRRKKWW